LRFIRQNIVTHTDGHVRMNFLIVVVDRLTSSLWNSIQVNFQLILHGVGMDGHELIQLLSTQLVVSFPEQLGLVRFNLFGQLFLRFDDELKQIEVGS